MLSDNNNIQRSDVLESINLLEKIRQYYRDIKQQRKAFDKILSELREVYKHSSHLFSKLDIMKIRSLVNAVENHNDELQFNKEKLYIGSTRSLPKGTVVLHKTEYYVGVIVDSRSKTTGKSSEDQNNVKDYRIFISEKEVKFATPLDLIVIGSSVINYCFICNGIKSIFSKKCKECNWVKCSHCGSCHCNYINDFKPETKPLRLQVNTKGTGRTISLCVNCRKFRDKSCPGPNETMGSYNRKVNFCSAYSPRRRNSDF